MGRPRKYVRPKLRRKCHQCGKMSNNVYVHEVVPSFDFVYDIPPYAGRNKEKLRSILHSTPPLQSFGAV